MKPTRIITHDGPFHADEVFAIALVHEFYGTIAFTRTRIVHLRELEDDTIMVLDEGGKFEPSKLNFDHHHDKTLPATVLMVLNHLFNDTLLNKEHYDVLISPITAISTYDTNGSVGFNGFQVNEFIKSLNTLPGDETKNFAVAVSFARTYVNSKINLVNNEKPKSYGVWLKGETIDHVVKVCEEYPYFWKDYKEQPFLVYPTKGIWRLLSADTELFPIVATGTEISINDARFVADYRTKTDAITAARKSTMNAPGKMRIAR